MNKTWRYKRLFEILPGAIVWVVLMMPVILSITAPKYLAIYLLVFVTFWLIRTFFMSSRLIYGYINYKNEIRKDWFSLLKKQHKDWHSIVHLIIVPTYKEEYEILESSVESVINSNYDTKKIIYLLAYEERDKERGERIASMLQSKYQDKLHDFVAIMHPKDIQGEIIGKGPNITFAAKKFDQYFDKNGILAKNVLVTTMDADNRMDKEYLACLTYNYLKDSDPVHKSFQPIPMFFNNIWDVPMFTRLIAMGSSFWQLIVSTRPSRLRNFSAHAQSLEALREVDFWSTETIVEDGHQYWRSYYKFNGNHHVVPLFTPIYQDAVLAGTLRETIVEQYLQKKRWSWGVSDIAYVMENTIKNKKIPWIDKWANALILWESHISWSTTSIVMATSAWLPLVLNPYFKSTVMAYNFPIIYRYALAIAWIGMIVTLIISTLLVPPHKKRKPVLRIILDWILTPIVLPLSNIFFSSLPALHSQTRLMLGKYLEYRVTVKSTKRSNI